MTDAHGGRRFSWRKHWFHVLLAPLYAWIAGCFLAFLAGPVSGVIPAWVPRPWSDVRSFAATSDGRVFVDIAFYERVCCYDARGRFVAAYPEPASSGGDKELSVDDHDRVYYRNRSSVFVFTPEWKPLGKHSAADSANRTWELTEQGQPRYAPERSNEPSTRRPVREGEVLFGNRFDSSTWSEPDGTEYVSRDDEILRTSPDGSVQRFSGPRWLRPFEFPIPAALAWPGTFLLGFIGILRAKLRRNRAR